MNCLLVSLIQVSEKAANIARICRQNEHLFRLLIQEKKEGEKNPRFVEDFKTLGDVLIQETVKHDIGKQFPEMVEYIKGEESNLFSNTLGDSICVTVQEDKSATALLLDQVLNGDSLTADLLATEVHRDISVEDVNLLPCNIPENVELPLDQLGIWIDPIDSTAEYVNGSEVSTNIPDIHASGLRCVTVLLGVFHRATGEAILGVINQPFYMFQNSRWQGRCFWGVSYEDIHYCSVPQGAGKSEIQKVIVLSSNEEEFLKNRLSEAGYIVVTAAGAGYKCLCVALGHAGAYLLSKSSTFRWDTCAPHALLRASLGGIVSYKQAEQGELKQITYMEEDEVFDGGVSEWCNWDGIIAYRDPHFMEDLLEIVKGK